MKSVIVEMLEDAKQAATTAEAVAMKGEPLPVVDESMRIETIRSADPQETAIRENIKKAQRTIYGLMAAGLHGENGLDPETADTTICSSCFCLWVGGGIAQKNSYR